MWIFSKGNDSYCLLAGRGYDVGRGGSGVVIPGDPSVSRKHARLTVTASAVRVTDAGSTYGTYVGEEAIRTSAAGSQEDRLKTKGGEEARDGTRMRFGLHSTIFELEKTVFLITTSTLPKPDKERLLTAVNSLQDVTVTNQWNDSVTHLVMKDVLLTVKVANALAKGIPIVTPEFFSDFHTCARSGQVLPDPENYLPPLKETTINASKVSLKVEPSRSKVFGGKTFVFKTTSQSRKFESAIRYGGGAITTDGRDSDDAIYVKPDDVEEDSSRYRVPESHIGLAVLFNSTAVYCNPSYSPTVVARPEMPQRKTLVPETQSKTTQIQNLTATTKVPETLPESRKSSTEEEEESSSLFSLQSERLTHSEVAASKGRRMMVPETQSKLTQERTKPVFTSTTKIPETQLQSRKSCIEEEESSSLFSFQSERFTNDPKERRRPSSDYEESVSKRIRLDNEKDVPNRGKASGTLKGAAWLTGRTSVKRARDDLNSVPESDDDNEETQNGSEKRFKITEEKVNDEDDLFGKCFSTKKTSGFSKAKGGVEPVVDPVKKTPPKDQSHASEVEERMVKSTSLSSSKNDSSISSVVYRETVVDENGFISKSKTKTSSSSSITETENDSSRSYIRTELADLYRNNVVPNRPEKVDGNTSERVVNFKRFKSNKSRKIPPLRITTFVKTEEETFSSNASIKDFMKGSNNNTKRADFFDEDERRNLAESQEAEDFWNFQVQNSKNKKKFR